MLIKIFAISPKEFDRDGVWFYPHESNPIYALNLDGPGVRERVAAKFLKMANDRKMLEKP
jgi:hypothetical protein